MDAIIFDVDGTLWDSTPQVAIAWQMIAKNRKVPYEHITPERLHREFGKMMKDIAYSIFPDLSKEDALGVLKECMDYEVAYLLSHPPLPYDGVEQVFKYFNRKMPLFIVSNCQAGYIETFLETSDLSEYITCHLCPDDTGLNKAGNIKRSWTTSTCIPRSMLEIQWAIIILQMKPASTSYLQNTDSEMSPMPRKRFINPEI